MAGAARGRARGACSRRRIGRRTCSRGRGCRARAANLELLDAAGDVLDARARRCGFAALGAGRGARRDGARVPAVLRDRRDRAAGRRGGRRRWSRVLRVAAGDPRWRVRESVAIALQRWGDADVARDGRRRSSRGRPGRRSRRGRPWRRSASRGCSAIGGGGRGRRCGSSMRRPALLAGSPSAARRAGPRARRGARATAGAWPWRPIADPRCRPFERWAGSRRPGRPAPGGVEPRERRGSRGRRRDAAGGARGRGRR